jgi:hypothetical protein
LPLIIDAPDAASAWIIDHKLASYDSYAWPRSCQHARCCRPPLPAYCRRLLRRTLRDSICCLCNPSSSPDSHLDSLEAARQVGFVYHPYIVQPYAVHYSYTRSGRSSSCGRPPKPTNEPSSTSIMDYEVPVGMWFRWDSLLLCLAPASHGSCSVGCLSEHLAGERRVAT